MARCTPWDELLLVGLVGREVLRERQSPVWHHADFIAWIGDQARAHVEHRAGGLADEKFLACGRDLRVRVLARSLGVRRALHPPVIREGTEGGAHAAEHPSTEPVVPVINLGVAAGVGRELWDEVPDGWIVPPPDIAKDRYVALRIIGESMTPLMHTGDVVLVRLSPEVNVDTVIVARHPDDGYVCKRVRRIKKRGVELASLEIGRPLIVIPPDPALIVGTVLLVWCAHREQTIRPGLSDGVPGR